MRRKDREVTDFHKIIQFIDSCDILRIGLADGDFPYIVPLNFAYTVEGEQICFYIHGAKAGRKYELLRKNPHCSFEMDIPLKMECLTKERDVTMRYRSVMGTAEAVFLEGEEKERAVDEIIMARYEETKSFSYNKNVLPRTAVIRLKVLEINAKENPVGGTAD